MFPFIITDTSIVALFPSGPKSAQSTHLNFTKIRDQIKTGQWAGLEDLFDVKGAIIRWTSGLYRITDEGVYRGTERIPDCIERRVLQFMDEGLPFEPLLKFHERLAANPSRRAVQELYKFLENKNIPIGPDGCFYGYKSVRLDWKDIHSGTFSNHIGAVLEMPRNQVDDDCHRTCSYGFHVGALEYVRDFGGSRENKHMIIVKVDPADVVSVPIDYNGQKMRVCKYVVVSEYTGPLPETYYEVPSDDEPEEILEEEDDGICPECENELEEDWVACPYCGFSF
jgi:hypothetical protein